jgi:hypothetical protein
LDDSLRAHDMGNLPSVEEKFEEGETPAEQHGA